MDARCNQGVDSLAEEKCVTPLLLHGMEEVHCCWHQQGQHHISIAALKRMHPHTCSSVFGTEQ